MARFQRGISGNPDGRPRRQIANLGFEARKWADLALRTPVQVCREGKADRDRLAAADALLDRGFGKPAQQSDVLTVEKRLSELTNDEFAALEARLMLSAADARLVFGWRQTARKPDPSAEAKPNQGPGPREGSQQSRWSRTTTNPVRRRNGFAQK